MKIDGMAGPRGRGEPSGTHDPAACGVATSCFAQRSHNSETNAVASISNSWTNGRRQYVAKKSDRDGMCAFEEPTKKNCLRRSSESRSVLDIRSRNRPIQSGISQPMNNIG